MKTYIHKIVFLITVVFSTSHAQAYDLEGGFIKGYLPYAQGGREIFFFNVDSTVASGCNVTNRYAIDNTKDNFKSVVSAVMAAYHSKTAIKVRVIKECNVFPNAFDANYICVGDVPC